MGLLQHTEFLEHTFFLSLNFYDFHLHSTSSINPRTTHFGSWQCSGYFHLRRHKRQFPSLSLTFSPARSALSTRSDLPRTSYFPSRCQSPLGLSSVADHLKSQPWILCTPTRPSDLSGKPAPPHSSRLRPLLLLPARRLSWERDCPATWPRVQTQVSSLCQAFGASSQGSTSLGQFSISHPFHQHCKHSWLPQVLYLTSALTLY